MSRRSYRTSRTRTTTHGILRYSQERILSLGQWPALRKPSRSELAFPDVGLLVNKIQCQWNGVAVILFATLIRPTVSARDEKQRLRTEAVLYVAHARALSYLELCTITNELNKVLGRVCAGPRQTLSSLYRSHNLTCRHRGMRCRAATKNLVKENPIAVHIRLCCVNPPCDSLGALPSDRNCVV